MAQINLKSNYRALISKVDGDRRDLITRAAVRALNRTAVNVRTAAVRELRKVYNIRADVIRGQMSIRQAHPGRLAAEVIANGHRIPLIEFGAKWSASRPGVSVAVRKGSRKTIPGTFIATMASGHVDVFERAGRARLPIETKYSIGVPGMFGASQVQEVLAALALDRFTVNLNAQLDFLFRR